MSQFRRRQFLIATSVLLVAPLAEAQQAGKVRRIGALIATGATDPQALANIAAFLKSLSKLGWTAGTNVVIDYRWSAGDPARAQLYARELAALAPDVILASGNAPVSAVHKETRSIPIVFTRFSDPVGQGLVANLAHPGGNVTGFTNFDLAMGGKWLQILKEVAPGITRVAVVANPEWSPLNSWFRSIEASAKASTVGVVAAPVRDVDGIERVINGVSGKAGGALIIAPDGFTIQHRAEVIAAAAKFSVPAIYPFRSFATDGGLISYGVDTDEQFREAASYVDRILRGTKPGDLPIGQPTKFELVINVKTAKTLGLEIPQSLLLRADEVIE
jgi:ABC-type uncharacterized transport system substrate-binding protein